MSIEDLHDPEGKPLGRRERNKIAKEHAIRTAARSLFLEKGYDATTLREIAEVAGVGFGTLFAYSTDKAGLLAMIFVEQLRSLPPLFADCRETDTLDTMLIDALAHLYRFWARVPTLSKHVLQQMEFYSANPSMESIVTRRHQARAEIAAWIERMQAKGRIASELDHNAAAATIFAIYTSAVREWAATTPEDVDAGLAQLRRLMTLPLRSLAA